MSIARSRNRKIRQGLIFLACAAMAAQAQIYPGQPPPPVRTRSFLDSILGPDQPGAALPKEVHVCLVWGYDNAHHDPDPNHKVHPPGAHEFRKFKDEAAKLLIQVPGVKADSAFYFPTAAQWRWADVVIWHLQPDFFVDSQYAYIDAFQARGGGMLVLGEATIMRPTGQAWAARIGLAWSEGTSKWGPLPVPQEINLASKHPLIAGFPPLVDFSDEFYWNLVAGNEATLTALGSSRAGATGNYPPWPPEKMPATRYPAFWAYEKGPGKVFATCMLHNFWTFNDPLFRILLFRAIAWEAGVPFHPFRPLVTAGVPVVEGVRSTARRPTRAARLAGGSPGTVVWKDGAGVLRGADGAARAKGRQRRL